MSVLERQLALLESGLEGASEGGWRDRRKVKQVKKRRLEIAADEKLEAETVREKRKARNIRLLSSSDKDTVTQSILLERLSKSRPVIDVHDAEKTMEMSSIFNFDDDDAMVEKPELDSVDEEDSILDASDSDSDGPIKMFRFPDEA